MSDADLKRKPTDDENQFKSNETKTDQAKVTGNKDFKTFQKKYQSAKNNVRKPRGSV